MVAFHIGCFALRLVVTTVLCGVRLQLADRERDNCWREMSSSTVRGRDVPDLLSVITPQTYLARSAL